MFFVWRIFCVILCEFFLQKRLLRPWGGIKKNILGKQDLLTKDHFNEILPKKPCKQLILYENKSAKVIELFEKILAEFLS